MPSANNAQEEERVSISTPERGAADETGPGMYLLVRVMGKGECSDRQDVSSTEGSENGEMQWTPRRVIHCAETIGMTVDGSRGGWTPLVEFAREGRNKILTRKGTESPRGGGERIKRPKLFH